MTQEFDIQDVLQRAEEAGLNGMGGRCGWAAIAINRVLFDGQAQMSGAFNAAFMRKGAAIGHVAVFHDGAYWDSDASPKDFEEIESFGMLDEHDPDYQERAEELGIKWPTPDNADEADEEHPAYEVLVSRMTEKEILEQFPDEIGHIEEMEDLLRAALFAHQADRKAPAAGVSA